jgi:hypothetical protein
VQDLAFSSFGSLGLLLVDPNALQIPVGILIILLGVGAMVAIIRWSGWVFHPRRLGELRGAGLRAATQDERFKALEAYQQLASEKLDVIKTAIAMGYNEQELNRLDARLEQLIGADAVQKLVRGDIPLPSRELERATLDTELRAIREGH